MIKLFSLKDQEKSGQQGANNKKRQSAAQLRIAKDMSELQLPKTCEMDFPDPNDMLNFRLTIMPDEGYYRNGKFVFSFLVGPSYPHEPPKVKCITSVYHPNIDLEGNVCLNILREDWKPVLTINSIVYGLQYLFLEPNPEDPLNKDAAEVLGQNKRLFEQNVQKAMRACSMYLPAKPPFCSVMCAAQAMFVSRPIRSNVRQYEAKKKIPGVGPRNAKLKPPALNFPYFSITFGTPDELKLVDADQLAIDTVHSVLEKHWPDGIHGEKSFKGIYYFKLGGSPFFTTPFSLSKKDEALAARHVTCALLRRLKQIGWKLILASDLAKTWDLSTWFFERISYKTLPESEVSQVVGLSMSSDDKFQLVCAQSSLHSVLKSCVGPILEKEKTIGNDYELKLTGDPWDTSNFDEGTNARRLMMEIFTRFEKNGFKFVGTANLKNTADTIYFEEDRASASSDCHFLTISLHGVSQLRVIEAPDDVIQSVVDCINKHWPEGIHEKKEHKEIESVELNLNGQPWCCDKEQAVSARLVLTAVFQVLSTRGWTVVSALDMSRASDKASIMFRKEDNTHSKNFFCLAPMNEDKLKLINAPQEVIDVVGEIISTQWPHGVQRTRAIPDGFHWKLKGEPWHAYQGTDCCQGRHLLALILHKLSKIGWNLVCSADVSAKMDGHRNSARSDVCSWFFGKNV